MIGRSTRPRSALLLVWIVLGAFVAALTPALPAHAQQTTLVVTGYGGRWSEVMKKALVEPFEKKHNVKVEVVTGISTEWVAKLMASGPDNPPFDVLFGNEPAFPIPRERGFFDKRNETLAPVPGDRAAAAARAVRILRMLAKTAAP
jgi:spermidine/putrescine-binding protein